MPDNDVRPANRVVIFISLLTVGVAGIALPLILRRVSRRALATTAPPVRVAGRYSSPVATSLEHNTSDAVARRTSDASPVAGQALSAALAFGLATGIVGATTYIGIQTGQRYWKIRDVDDLTHRLRTHVPRVFPHVREMLHRALERDVESDIQGGEGSPQEWDYEQSKQRLMHAYEEGGLDRLVEVAAEELRGESRWLLRKKQLEDAEQQQGASSGSS